MATGRDDFVFRDVRCGWDNRNQIEMVPIDDQSLPVTPSSVAVKLQRVLAVDMDPDRFPGGLPDVVVITMGGETVRYVRETEVR